MRIHTQVQEAREDCTIKVHFYPNMQDVLHDCSIIQIAMAKFTVVWEMISELLHHKPHM